MTAAVTRRDSGAPGVPDGPGVPDAPGVPDGPGVPGVPDGPDGLDGPRGPCGARVAVNTVRSPSGPACGGRRPHPMRPGVWRWVLSTIPPAPRVAVGAVHSPCE
ncbi:hypothetical protein GCM10023335_10970 [Streptomyces siamensis]|uniref:Collagen-like protein n=1 Tax=Streptomyces siamensis TaxID=1274986 RepID=A0ABP9IIL6_9ACTN